MKLLPAPYGWPNGRALTLLADNPVDPALLEQFGCPPTIAAKAVSCLNHSGEYSCRVQEHVAMLIEQKLEVFVEAKVGVVLETIEEAEATRETWRRAAGQAPRYVVYLTDR